MTHYKAQLDETPLAGVEHGTLYGYIKGCRCIECRMSNAFWHADHSRTRIKGNKWKLKPKLTRAWKKAVDSGLAEALATRIIQERDVPITLLATLAGEDHRGPRRFENRGE